MPFWLLSEAFASLLFQHQAPTPVSVLDSTNIPLF